MTRLPARPLLAQARRAPVIVLVLMTASAVAQTPPDSSAARAAEKATPPRPTFVLPDVLIEGEDLSRFAAGSRRLELSTPAVRPAQQPALVSPGPTYYRRRTDSPFSVTLPEPAAVDRPKGLARVSVGDGASRELALALSPAPSRQGWAAFTDWRHRVEGRSHRGLDLGFVALGDGADPAWSSCIDAAVRHEEWAPNEDYAYTPADEAVTWRGRCSLERRFVVAGTDALMSPRVSIGGSEIRAARGGWQALDLRLRRVGVPAELRGSAGAAGSDGAGSRLEVDLAGGVVRHRNRDGERTDGRFRCRCGWSARWRGGLFALGIAGGGEGSRGVLGPWIAWRRLLGESGWLVALEAAPEVTFFEEWWGGWERLSAPGLLQEEAGPGRLPFAAQILDPVQPAQRAWPRLALEAQRQDAAGWLRATAVIAEVADPFDWESATAAGTTLLATSHNERRRLIEAVFSAERRLRPGLRLKLDYRWARDERRGTAARLLLLPQHRLRGALGWEPGDWRAAAAIELRSERSVDSAGARLRGSTALGARIGHVFGGHTLSLVGENLLQETLADWPGEVRADRWFGLEWRYGWNESLRASVP
ncbi:MAG: hypothetical protein V1774_06515 [Candidatus Eisenbacteria bacterium]